MQRFSTTALTLALTTFVAAFSLALIAAAWMMASYFINGVMIVFMPK